MARYTFETVNPVGARVVSQVEAETIEAARSLLVRERISFANLIGEEYISNTVGESALSGPVIAPPPVNPNSDAAGTLLAFTVLIVAAGLCLSGVYAIYWASSSLIAWLFGVGWLASTVGCLVAAFSVLFGIALIQVQQEDRARAESQSLPGSVSAAPEAGRDYRSPTDRPITHERLLLACHGYEWHARGLASVELAGHPERSWQDAQDAAWVKLQRDRGQHIA